MEYSWDIEQCDYDPQTGAIFTVHWSCNASDNNTYARSYGSIDLEIDLSSNTFKTYTELTKTEVLDWVWQHVSKDTVETMLADRILSAQQSSLTAAFPIKAVQTTVE
jgi:hypothetical protein